MEIIRRLFVKLIIYVVMLYKKGVSPLLSPRCRFIPTCSDYAIQALNDYGLCKGGMLFARRFLRCHPFSKGGFDPVPLTSNEDERSQ